MTIEDDKFIELQKKLMEKLLPLEKLPKEIVNIAYEYTSFRRELTKESDRGCALLAASHLDFLLSETLKAKMIGTPKELKALLDFNGPLGTFSSRILISYSIGLITKFHTKDLQLIRKIRNEFGHSTSIKDFENPKIKQLCDQLKLTIRSNKTSKSKFISSVSFITGALSGLIIKTDKFATKEEIDVEKFKDINDAFRLRVAKELGIDPQ
jgi:hypothetical protein